MEGLHEDKTVEDCIEAFGQLPESAVFMQKLPEASA